MNLYVYAAFLAVVTGAALAIFVGYKSWNNLTRRYFSIFTALAAVWCIFPLGAALPPTEELRLLVARTSYMAAAFTPALLLNFVFAVTEDKRWRLKRTILILSYLGSVSFFLLAHHPKYIVGLIRYAPHFAPIPGKLFIFFIIFYGMGCMTAFVILVQNFLIADLKKKNQMSYLFVAFPIALFSPVMHFGGYYFHREVIPHDFLFVTYSSILTYAIVRHQLMDIDVLIKKTLQFAGLSLVMFGIVATVAFWLPQWLFKTFHLQVHPSIPTALSVVINVLLIDLLRNFLVRITDKWLFQKKFDYKQLLKKFTEEVGMVLDLKQVAQMTVNTFADTVKLEGAALLLLSKESESRKYELAAAKGGVGGKVVLEELDPFVVFLRETHSPIGQDGELGKVQFPPEVRNRLRELNARLCLPLHVHEDLIGVLCLGKKKSDEEFAKDDMDILIPLSRTLAIAISNAKLVEENTQAMALASFREKQAMIGTLSAGINHEICNPLGIVKAQCEAFLLDAEDGILVGKTQQDILERTSNILRVALKQIDRATTVTQTLSNFAKPIKEVKAQAVNISAEVDEVLLLVGHDLKLDKIDVIKEIPEDLPRIAVDRRQLQQVLFNLIRNAGQAIVAPGKIWVRAHGDGERVKIEIVDTGAGIPPERLEKIGNPFFTTKEPGKGTGLGLFITRQLIESNKGRMQVESIVGKGTTFILDFPVAKEAAPATAGASK